MIAGDQVPYDLLDDVKNHLDITWEDDALDRKITELIAAGEIYIDSKLGERGNYLEAGWPRTLLVQYARYDLDGAMDIFENNDAHLLLAMQNERAVQRYAQNADEAER